MALFSYKAQDEKGEIINEITQAGSRSEAVSALKSSGLKVLTLKNIDTSGSSLFEGSVSVSDKASFARFLATMLRAGLPLSEGLDVIAKETPSQKLIFKLVKVRHFLRL